jgi:hypothetical protein
MLITFCACWLFELCSKYEFGRSFGSRGHHGYPRFETAQTEVASLSFDVLTAPEVVNVKDRLKTVYRRQAAVDHRLTHQLTSQASPIDLGGK